MESQTWERTLLTTCLLWKYANIKKTMIIRWMPIIQTEDIPPFGDELVVHLASYKGKVKYESCSAWGLLYKTLIDNRLTIPLVSFTSSGKPYFIKSSIQFSISHSRDICAVVVANCPVGVDVEIVKGNYPLHLIERSLTKAELASFDGDFTRIWCRKEALAKMGGEGIMGYPNYIDTNESVFYESSIVYGENNYWLVATKSSVAE